MGMSRKWPAGTSSLAAGLIARKIVSIVVLVVRAHQPQAAGGPALTTVPSGTTTRNGRNCPSLTGSVGGVRHLNPERAIALAPDNPVLIDPRVCGGNVLQSTVIWHGPLTTLMGRSLGRPTSIPASSR